jgi:phosphatidylethanolamine/phosphatidyl-N-methylethanolamine N-methyltransferase
MNLDQVSSPRDEMLFFLRRWVRHPLRLGAVIPSSKALTTLVAEQVKMRPDRIVVELGPGTGCLTRSLLEAGVPKERLFVVELDPELCAYLKRALPEVQVIHGNACDLPSLIPQKYHGGVSTVISGIPMTTLSHDIQRSIINAAFSLMDKEGELLQYTYRPISPIPAGRLGLSKKRVGVIFRNLPPATVWRYQRAA